MNVSIRMLVTAILLISSGAFAQSALPEWSIKRKEVFEFTRKPSINRSGDRVEISFATKEFCDVTIAIEDSGGRIIRHLACGVLGENAPEPFRKNSLEQKIIWDGKGDQGDYVKTMDDCTVRVSLGLKPQFERGLFWSPKKRIGAGKGIGGSTYCNIPTPVIHAAPEGVYVYEGHGVDHLRLFSHDAEYLRTIYPFPANKVMSVKGIKQHRWAQDGKVLPEKDGFTLSTLLTSGSNGQNNGYTRAMWGAGAVGMAVHGKRIALTHYKLNRLSTDGSSGGLDLTGPTVTLKAFMGRSNRRKDAWYLQVSPLSGAFSPDGKKLYLTGFMWRDGVMGRNRSMGCLHAVTVMDFETNGPPKLFAGSLDQQKFGKKPGSFDEATSVDVDRQGRVYVSDYMNDRVQVFSTDGKFLKAIKAFKPAQVRLNQKTGELWVASWSLFHDYGLNKRGRSLSIPATLNNLGTFEKPGKRAGYKLPLHDYNPKRGKTRYAGLEHFVEVDLYSNPPQLWMVSGSKGESRDDPGVAAKSTGAWVMKNVERYVLKSGGKMSKVEDFNKTVQKKIVRARTAWNWRQRLYCNPRTGKLYIAEGNKTRWYKGNFEVVEVDPRTGKVRDFEIPFATEDMAFDLDGFVYLRTNKEVVRYDMSVTPWREIPFDYGVERTHVGVGSTAGATKWADVIGSLDIPGEVYPSLWHLGGMWVNAKGNVAVACLINKNGNNVQKMLTRSDERTVGLPPTYVPRLYPGRAHAGETHVWDKHGKLLYTDALPGTHHLYGVALDKDDNLYATCTEARWVNGKVHHNRQTGTLFKVKPDVGKLMITTGQAACVEVKLKPESTPKRPPDVFNSGGKKWLENADWLYGGVSFSGKGAGKAGGGCSCYNARFTLDYFARSFAPEVDRYHVAVLDSNGNLILRVGRYGNVDDGVPLVKDGSPGKRRLGGDEVSLVHAAYVAADTDRRLFIADAGNARVVSVKLGYHAAEMIPLRTIRDEGKEVAARK